MMRPLFRSLIVLLPVLGLVPSAAAQAGGPSFGHARTREAAELGRLPTPLEVAVADIANYHRHRLPLPRDDQEVMLQLRCGSAEAAPGARIVLQCGYTTAPGDDRADLPPLNLALVIDRSGSMDEANKLTAVKQALQAFVGTLRPADRVALVTYDNEAVLAQPSRSVDDGHWLRSAIARIETGGGTNLHAGLMLGLREVAAHARAETSNRVLLLTDGIANQGVTDPERILADARSYTAEDVDLSTIGVGHNLDTALLDRLARGGRGARDHRGRQASELALVAQVPRPGLGRVEHVLVELRLGAGECLHQLAEAGLARRRQRHAGKAEVAQQVVEQLALRTVERRTLALADRLAGPREDLVLAHLGVVVGEQHAAAVVGGAQVIAVEHRIQVLGRCPHAGEGMIEVLEWLDQRSEGRHGRGEQAGEPGAVALDRRGDRRLDVLRADPGVAGQAIFGQQRVVHGSLLPRCADAGNDDCRAGCGTRRRPWREPPESSAVRPRGRAISSA